MLAFVCLARSWLRVPDHRQRVMPKIACATKAPRQRLFFVFGLRIQASNDFGNERSTAFGEMNGTVAHTHTARQVH